MYHPKSKNSPMGNGRPPGSANKMAAEARRKAQETGELPHEFLLRVCRGEVVKGWAWDPVKRCAVEVYESADLNTRVDAAKACASYFAPKLGAVEITRGVIGGANDDELDQLITDLAAQAGINLGLAGESEEEGEEGSDTGSAGSSTRSRVRVRRDPSTR